MTEAQRAKIYDLEKRYKDNCNMYVGWGSSGYCKFGVYRSDMIADQNVTVIMTLITGISKSERPYVETENILVEPDGSTMDLMEVYSENQVVGYLERLNKIDY